MAAEKTYNNLDISVIKALEYRSNRFDGVACCTKNETLGVIMERIVNKEVHRLVVVDDDHKVIGIISLSDILTYIVLKQSEISACMNTDATIIHENKTNLLAHAFGQTRLSSSIDHVIINKNETNGSNTNMSINDKSPDSRTSSPIITTVNQPQISNIDQQSIFEDDPMDTESIVK